MKQQEALKKIAPIAWKIARPRIEDQAATFAVDFLNRWRNRRLGIGEPVEPILIEEKVTVEEAEPVLDGLDEPEFSPSGRSLWPLLSSGIIGIALGIIWGLIFRRRLV